MSKTHSILSEPPILITPSLACHIGLDAAVMVQKISFLCNTPRSGKVIDGEKWIFNTLAQWQEIFPFWSQATIRRLISELEKCGVLMSKQPEGNNRTKFYRINQGVYEALTLEALERIPSAQNEQFQVLKLSRCYKTEESTEESKGCVPLRSTHSGGVFSDKNPRPTPQNPEEMDAILTQLGIEPEPERDGDFYNSMRRARWRVNGKRVADWVALYQARVDKIKTDTSKP
jgi:hypothetical protein